MRKLYKKLGKPPQEQLFFSLKTTDKMEACRRTDAQTRRLDALWKSHREGKNCTADPHVSLATLEAIEMKPGDALRYPDHPAISDFVDRVIGQFEAHEQMPRISAQDQLTLGAFAADLIHHATHNEAGGFFYRPSDKDMMGQTLVSVRCFEQLQEFWPQMGLMEVSGFFRVREDWEGEDTGTGFGRAKRFRATSEMLTLASGFGITPDALKEHFAKEVGRISPVTVRSEEPNRKGYGTKATTLRLSGPRYEKEVQRVQEINNILAEGGFDLRETPRAKADVKLKSLAKTSMLASTRKTPDFRSVSGSPPPIQFLDISHRARYPISRSAFARASASAASMRAIAKPVAKRR